MKIIITLISLLLFFSCEKKEDLDVCLLGSWEFVELKSEDGTIETLEDIVWAEFFGFYHAPGITFNSNSTFSLYYYNNDSLTIVSGPENTEWSFNKNNKLNIYVGDTGFRGEFTINRLDKQTVTWHQIDTPENSWIKYQRQ